MTEQGKKKARDRILETAVHLFAQRGYASVGVREIAQKAGVNISMISYYFNGKVGILMEILDRFHERYLETLKASIDDNIAPEACLERIISGMIDFVRDNTELAMVAFDTLPLDIPEITERKSVHVQHLMEAVSGLFLRLGLDPNDRVLFAVVGPALLSIVLAHFRLRPIQKKVLQMDFNNAFYDRYKAIISGLFLKGVTGIKDLSPSNHGEST